MVNLCQERIDKVVLFSFIEVKFPTLFYQFLNLYYKQIAYALYSKCTLNDKF